MSQTEVMPDFGLEGFDYNAAFQSAINGVMSDAQLALDQKVIRMETIVTEGSSELYRDFVDFRSMAAQIEMFCAHDHAMSEAVSDSETLSGFGEAHGDHQHAAEPDDQVDDDDDEESSSSGKKKKRKGWLSLLMEKN